MSALFLKVIAYASMIIDHIGLLSDLPDAVSVIFRCVGRISFPLFAFMICEGYKHTKNKLLYLVRLVTVGIITVIPYSLCFYSTALYFQKFNVMFTLAAGLICIMLTETLQNKFEKSSRFAYLAASSAALIATVVIAHICGILGVDYGAWGVLLIYSLYLCRDRKAIQALIIVLFACENLPYIILNASELDESSLIMISASFSIIPILIYNGKQGYSERSRLVKYLFYAIYPLHLLVFWFVL